VTRFTNHRRAGLASISHQEVGGTRCFFIQDEYIDVVVERTGRAYRILDLDEAADALTAEVMSQARLAGTGCPRQDSQPPRELLGG
jgi:hypothetical protein